MNAVFYGLALLVVALVLGLALMNRPKEGFLYGWLFALLLLPGWLEAKTVGKFVLDLRTVAVLAACLGVMIRPIPRIRVRWALTDWLFCALMGSMVVSEYRCGDFGMMTVPTVFMHWGLPYLVGRHFFRSVGNLEGVERFLTFAIVYLTLYGVFEMASRTNPFLLLTGQRFVLLELEQGHRLGLRTGPGDEFAPNLLRVDAGAAVALGVRAGPAGKRRRGRRRGTACCRSWWAWACSARCRAGQSSRACSPRWGSSSSAIPAGGSHWP